jgi:hypothetical protein
MSEETDTGEVLDAIDAVRDALVAREAAEIGDFAKGHPVIYGYWKRVGAQLAGKPYNDYQLRQAAGMIKGSKTVDHCGLFQLWALTEEGLINQPWPTGSTFLRKEWITKDPKKGDIFLQPVPFQHHGMVVRRYLGTDGLMWLESIEANTPTTVKRNRREPRGLVYYSIEPLIRAKLGL